MTDKELRKLKRAELLEILFYLQKELDRMKQENEELKQRLDVNREIPEEFAHQIENIVHRAVSSYFDQKPSEVKDDEKKNGEQAESGHNGEKNDANE